jgi:hypothetical protein
MASTAVFIALYVRERIFYNDLHDSFICLQQKYGTLLIKYEKQIEILNASSGGWDE